MMGLSIEKSVINSQKRNRVIEDIKSLAETFGQNNKQEVYLSGLPLIRTELSTRIANEMRWFLLASVVLSALILLLFFVSTIPPGI
jgi:predicted RND superfamily exporter protein